ncbi:MAG: helix-turn-helix family protein [Gemmatimonadetes bacterium]|nr:helix-turn-helix family protein [Gemmatimonadota bacterium]
MDTVESDPIHREQVSHVGALLKDWRSARRLSQLDLANKAEISSRHLSFVESGRAQPSREMVARLAEALEVPLRERNALLLAAGYAPHYRESVLAAPELATVRGALELILRHHEPYPAFVFNRHWDLLMANQGSTRFFGHLLGAPRVHSNIMHMVFDPAALRPHIVNWEECAGDLIRHLHNEVAAAPWDERARYLLAEVLAYPDVPQRWHARQLGAPTTPLLTAEYRHGAQVFRFFSTIATFGTPQDVTLDELRIECTFPADEATADAYRALLSG